MGVVVIGGGGGGGNQNVSATADGHVMDGEEVIATFAHPEDGKAFARLLNAERDERARFIPFAEGLTAAGADAAADPRA